MEQIENSEKTRIVKGHHGWRAEIHLNIKGFDYIVTTMKRNSGEIVCNAQLIHNYTSDGSFMFSPMTDTFIELARRKTTATEKAIKDIHFEGLMKFDAMDLPSKEEAYKIEPGQVIFLNGYGQCPVDHENLIVYKVEDDTVWYVNEQRLTLGSTSLHMLKPVEKLFGIGHYYKEGDKRPNMDAVNNLVISAALAENKRKEEAPEVAKRAAEEEAAAIEELKQQNPHLEQLPEHCRVSQVAKNVRKQLRHHFPDTDFSVISDVYSVNIYWTDGPATKEVDAVVDLFESYQTDETGDYRDYSPTLFTKAFGGVKYVFINRKSTIQQEQKMVEIDVASTISLFEATEETTEACEEMAGISTPEWEAYIEAVKNITCPKKDLSENDKEENDKAENAKIESMPVETAKPYIIEHSERAIALFNAPATLNKVFEAHYGVFKTWVSHNGNRGAWIFSKKRRNEIESLINTIL